MVRVKTLDGQVQDVIDEGKSINSLSDETRREIARYMAIQNIKTLWWVFNRHPTYTPKCWKNKMKLHLKDAIEAYRRDFGEADSTTAPEAEEKRDMICCQETCAICRFGNCDVRCTDERVCENFVNGECLCMNISDGQICPYFK